MKKRAPTRQRTRGRNAQLVRRGQLPKATRRRKSSSVRGRSSTSSTRSRSSARMTTDRKQIQQWVEARGGHPALVKRTAKGKPESGVIRIDFPGFSGAQSLKPISWEEWFDIFEDCQLAFLYQERTAGGKPSRFNKLVARE